MTSSSEIVAGVKTLIAAATKAPCLDHDEAQSTRPLPAKYTIAYVSRRFGGNVRGGTRETNLRRLQTRVVASSVDDLLLIEDRIAALFSHSLLDVASSQIHFEYESGGGESDWDSLTQRYHALTDWTFTV